MTVEPSLRLRVTDAVRRQLEIGDADTHGSDPVRAIADVVTREAPLLEEDDRDHLIRSVANGMIGLGIVDELLEIPDVTDVVVNGPGNVWIERAGRMERTPFVVDEHEISRCVERIVAPLGIRADRSNPIVDARLVDGSRVTVVLPPLAPEGPLLAIRRHPGVVRGLESFTTATAQIGLLERVLAERLNVLVYGATGSGKTSLLAAMLMSTGPDERIVIVEDNLELPVGGDNFVRLEARPSGPSGRGGATIRDLVRVSLRLRPDRLVVGEVRGSESVDMIWAMSTGHRGSISTCHASSPGDAITRLETMMLLAEPNLSERSVRRQIGSALDVLVGMRRAPDGTRMIDRIDLLCSSGNLRPLLTAPARTP